MLIDDFVVDARRIARRFRDQPMPNVPPLSDCDHCNYLWDVSREALELVHTLAMLRRD